MRSGIQREPAEAEEIEAAVARANAAAARLRDVYAAEWAPSALDSMFAALAAGRGGRAGRAEALQALYRLAHDMKGQGTTFGFPLLTRIGESLCVLLAGRDDASPGELDGVAALLDAARAILDRHMEGEPPAGLALVEAAARAVRRRSH